MKKSIIKFGMLSVGCLVLAFVGLEIFLNPETTAYDVQEIFGYLSIMVSLAFVFFGVKSYRDKELGGKITFGKALKVGMLITVFPALAFGLFDLIYSYVIYPGYYAEYYNEIYNNLPEQYSGNELLAQQKEVASWKEMSQAGWFPVFSFFLMSTTVLLLGFVVSLITSVTLRKK